jgi:hypothetical protein
MIEIFVVVSVQVSNYHGPISLMYMSHKPWYECDIKFNVIYFNCAFTKLIVPKEGNRTLAAMPARESWVGARLSNYCSPSVGMVDVTVTDVSVVFYIVQV